MQLKYKKPSYQQMVLKQNQKHQLIKEQALSKVLEIVKKDHEAKNMIKTTQELEK